MTAAGSPALILSILPFNMCICRTHAGARPPAWVFEQPFYAVTGTADELSLVLPEQNNPLPPDWQIEDGWRAFKVEGPLDFSLVGILAGISAVLAQAGVSLFAISTFDTDYILVKAHNLEAASTALRQAGHTLQGGAA